MSDLAKNLISPVKRIPGFLSLVMSLATAAGRN